MREVPTRAPRLKLNCDAGLLPTAHADHVQPLFCSGTLLGLMTPGRRKVTNIPPFDYNWGGGDDRAIVP